MAEISPLGAELKSLKDAYGTEYIWNSNPEYWGRSSPVLFPTVGMLKDNLAIINNVNYKLPRHGFARDMQFNVITSSQEQAVFSLKYSNETLEVYPYKFELRLSYSLNENSLDIRYDIINLDDKPIYYGIGAHPAFNCPIKDTEMFEEYIIEFSDPEPNGCPIYNTKTNQLEMINKKYIIDDSKKIKLKYNLFKDDAIIFDNIKSNNIKLYHGKSGRGIDFTFKGFKYLGLWTPSEKNSPFICLEPWASLPHCSDETGEFHLKRGVKQLGVNQKDSLFINICPI